MILFNFKVDRFFKILIENIKWETQFQEVNLVLCLKLIKYINFIPLDPKSTSVKNFRLSFGEEIFRL